MQVSDILSRKTIVTTGRNLNNPIVTIETTVGGKTKDKVGQMCDLAMEDFSDLICPEFRAWYCKAYYKIGGERFTILAKQARADGKIPSKLFSFLLRNELKK